MHFSEMFLHFGSLIVFWLVSQIYGCTRWTTQYMPYLYAVISYYSHTVFLFKGVFDVPGDHSRVAMTKDNLLRHVIEFGALCFNVIYIGVFLVVSRKDSIALNSLVYALFIFDVIRQDGKYFYLLEQQVETKGSSHFRPFTSL